MSRNLLTTLRKLSEEGTDYITVVDDTHTVRFSGGLIEEPGPDKVLVGIYLSDAMNAEFTEHELAKAQRLTQNKWEAKCSKGFTYTLEYFALTPINQP